MQTKPADVFIIKNDMQILNQKSDVDNLFVLGLQKRLLKLPTILWEETKKHEKKTDTGTLAGDAKTCWEKEEII